jgi:hypothetical protein
LLPINTIYVQMYYTLRSTKCLKFSAIVMYRASNFILCTIFPAMTSVHILVYFAFSFIYIVTCFATEDAVQIVNWFY